MYSLAKIIVFFMISVSNGFLFPSQFKYHNNPKSIVNYSSPMPIETYKRKNKPNEYGNLVAYSSPIKRSRTPAMLIDGYGGWPFRDAVDVAMFCIFLIFLSPPPPPPPSPPMTPLLVEEKPAHNTDDFVLGLLYASCAWSGIWLITV